MMKKIGLILFLAVFLLMCLWPLAGMLLVGPSEAAANEVLAQPPKLTETDGSFNPDVLKDAGDWLADHFASRQAFITAEAKLQAAIFRESAAEDVILGKDGWLYYQSTLDDYEGQNQLTDREIWSAAHCISMIYEYAQERNIRFLFTVAPNKNTLYPQYMPQRYLRSAEQNNMQRLMQALAEAGVPYLDLYEVFSAEDTVLYQKLDSHWNNLGAALAHDAITEALGISAETYYLPENYTAEANHMGDLYQMLYPAGTQKDVQMMPTWTWSFNHDKPIRSAEDQMIYTSCAEKNGKLMMFRDSFGNTLYPFMAESFGTACFSRAMPYTISMLDTEKPDTVVIEIVQRNLCWLVQRAPQMPAPIRQLRLPQNETTIDFTYTCTQVGENLFCYTGNIDTQTDTDSEVYILCDGTVYEAFPAGEAAGAYTAYLPTQAQTVQLLIKQDGQLLLSQPMRCENG